MLAGPVLAFDTSTAIGSVAVGVSGAVRAETSFAASGGHSSALLPAVQSVLDKAGVGPADLQAIVVGAGPGSFTGIRIAGATAKGMVHSLGIPLYAYSSLAAVAARVAPPDSVGCALFDARGRDVFVGCFRFGGDLETVVAPAAMDLDEAIARAAQAGAKHFAGDGALRHATLIRETLDRSVASEFLAYPGAAMLLWLAERYPTVGRVVEPAGWQPDYLRPSGAERIAAQGATAAGGARK